jgi:hypothetical protein
MSVMGQLPPDVQSSCAHCGERLGDLAPVGNDRIGIDATDQRVSKNPPAAAALKPSSTPRDVVRRPLATHG